MVGTLSTGVYSSSTILEDERWDRMATSSVRGEKGKKEAEKKGGDGDL